MFETLSTKQLFSFFLLVPNLCVRATRRILEFKHSAWAGSQVCILFVEEVASRRIKDESQTAFRKLHTFFAEWWLGMVRALKKRPIS